MSLPVLIILVYLLSVTFIGSLFARNIRGARDWAVAGGGMGLSMIAFGIAGTRIGGAGTYGVAGNVMSNGLHYMWWYSITTFLALAIVGLFFAVPYHRLGLQTVGEIFRKRFGRRRAQVVTSLCVQTEYAIINVIEAYVIGSIISTLTSIGMLWGTIIAAAVLVTYTSLGGLRGTAVTNLIHCIVIIGGLLLVSILGMSQAGGWQEVMNHANAHLNAGSVDKAKWWGFVGLGWGAVLGMFFAASIHTPAASVYTNYSTAARNETILLPAFLLAGGLAALMPLLAGLVGVITVSRYGVDSGLGGYTNLTRLAVEIHPVVGGIALAAVLAAVISSGGPVLLASATMFVRDWLPFTNDYSPEKKLIAYRITTIIYGFLAGLTAYAIATHTAISILDMLLFGYAMVVPPAIAVGYLIYWKRTTEAGAYWGIVSGYVVGLAWFCAVKWALAAGFHVDESASLFLRLIAFCFTHNGAGVDPSYATTLVPLWVVPIVSYCSSENMEGRDVFYAALRAGPAAVKLH